MADPIGFVLPESIDDDAFVLATYLYRGAAGTDAHRAALELAELQSTGTWTALARETATVRERHAGRVVAIWEVPDHELADGGADGPRDWVIQIGYPAHNIGAQIPLLLATAYGECASSGLVKLIDLKLPRSFVAAFRGPKFGIAGLRELVGAPDRPLLIAMMKPALGLTPAESADVFRELAVGGVDAVKDDELLVEHPWSEMVERVREHARAARNAYEETGHRTLHFVNVTDRPDRMLDRARRAVEAGASGLMVDFMTVGVSALSMLADDPAIAVPVLGHLAFAGAVYASPRTGVSSHLILGKLPRLAGADLIVYPSPYGSLSYARSKHLRLANAMTAPLHGLAPILPVPGGGLHPGMVPAVMADLGSDHGFGAGGALHGHPDGPAAGARAVRQAMDAVARGDSLRVAAAEHRELAAALARWSRPEPGADARPD
jgi:ribulose 1,5-bisphosphate carboxylase large subunit-like protein